ncbi:MAG: TadE/TadG family type IV pilus assembly protein [Bacillota bacterium]
MAWIRNICKRGKNEGGQALVELALILPVLIILLFGVIEFGRIFQAYLTVTYAAREGARAGATGQPDSAVAQIVSEASTGLDTSILQVAVSPTGSRVPGDPLTVSVVYPITVRGPFLGAVFPEPFLVTGRVVMRVE